MFRVVSGLPGAGKTLHTLKRYRNDARQIYYHNIPLTDHGKETLKWIELSLAEVKDWPNICGPDSVLIVDEAQMIWPVRPSSRAVPPELQALETHRHKGVDLEFISQDPTLMDTHIRKLANEHYHYTRPYGAKYSIQHYAGSGLVDIKSKTALNLTVKSRVGQPSEIYPLYKSAEVHTHKFKMPPVMFVIPVLFAIIAALIYYFISAFGSDEPDTSVPAVSSPAGVSAPAPSDHPDEPSRSSMGWAKLLTPEIRGLPYTAPLYRERAMQVIEVPRVAGCMTLNDTCNCFTQQGTIIDGITPDVCQGYIVRRPYDHLAYQHRDNDRRLESADGANNDPYDLRNQNQTALVTRTNAQREARARAWLSDYRPNVSVTR